MATADFNNDGDLDFVITRFRSEPVIFENTSTAPRIGVRLVGQPPNTHGIGARIIVEGGPVRQTKDIVAGGDYLSGSDPQQMFAASPENQNHRITVAWTSGKKTIVDSVAANRVYDIYEPEGEADKSPGESKEKKVEPLFNEISGHIDHSHQSDSFNDFDRQPTLPFKLSSDGPGIAWIDYDQDGDDDLFIGGNSTNKLSVYENRGNGKFNKIKLAGKEALSQGVTTSILGWPTAKYYNMVIGNSDYQLNRAQGSMPAVFRFLVGRDGSVKLQNIPDINASTGPVAATDYDGDGNIDLFVGGRVVPGKYPVEADSRLFRNNGEKFELDSINSRAFSELGLVTGAVFSDLSGNGRPDLLVSSEGGTLRLFENRNGKFIEVTDQMGLSSYQGWWSSVATGDFNNNGLIDIVATNFGKNSPYQLRSDQPLKMYYNDFNKDGQMEIIEAYYDESMRAYVPIRKLYEYPVFESIISGPINSYEQYAVQSLQELLGTPLSQVPYKKINTLEHMVFLNTGEGFEAHPLPVETQFSAATGVIVADYNNDGNEDLFISQNYFHVPEGIPRQDSGRGMLLKGNGKGHFTPVPGTESGIKVYGEQRGAAFGDFNKDGKVDLAVTQRDSTTKLYMNGISKQGIRVELRGPDQNLAGIGTGLRLIYEDGTKGPLREVQAGSGHYSMNSLVPVLGIKNKVKPVQLEVYWYDGETTSIQVEPDKWSYIVTHPYL